MGTSRALLDRMHGAVGRAREVTDHPVLTHVARIGLIAYGAMHLLIAYLAARLAWGARAGEPDDIAHTVSFLVSEGAGFVSGQVIYVAGGPRG